MSRRNFTVISAMALAGAAQPAPASADVLEVSAAGFGWVAGGPAAPAASSSPAPAAPDASSRAMTQVALTAGPLAWQAKVAELAARYDISPNLIEALVWQESRWNPRAVSPVGAQGLAQLMPATARQLSVDPRDPCANLEGGARYLRQQLDTFGGNLEQALAAYNAGPGRVRQYRGVPPYSETRNYVASILTRLSQQVRR